MQMWLQPNHHFMVKRFCDTVVADNMIYTRVDVILIQYDFFLTNVRPTVQAENRFISVLILIYLFMNGFFLQIKCIF